ncbi:Uncharacterized protein TCM_040294 [Theobroma cacao]|uniref:Uncharacterized protein n=1 Tax=Theobroma cacao TaxID=3641 RepID=A0A061GT99_THECC|nr:Uncharacterized protein TCM_040294 [Theobroma cacao]
MMESVIFYWKIIRRPSQRFGEVSKFSSPRDIPGGTRLYKLLGEIPSSGLPHHLQGKYGML